MKELLKAFLGDYLRIVEPDLTGHLGLGSLRFPDITGLQSADLAELLVAEARTSQGEQVTIAVLVEPEPLLDRELTRRLNQLFTALDIRLGRPVLVSFLFLRGGKPGVNLGTAPVASLAGLDNVRLYFSTFGLEGASADYYLERPEPVAWGLAAWMGSKRFDRAKLKRACRERIQGGGLDEDRRRLLLRCVDRALDAERTPELRI